MSKPIRCPIFFICFSALLTFCFCSCSTPRTSPLPDIIEAPAQPKLGGKRAMPFAYIYKTNGDYDNNVVVSYNRGDGTFISYPAPSDVSSDSSPLQLVDGWLLDRRGGVSDNTAFLRWTYGEYCRLDSTPTLEQLRAAILPDARIIAVQRLDMTTFDAQRDTAAVNKIILEKYK